MAKVDQWLEQLGLGGYAAVFADNDIDLDVLPDLTDADLAALGVSLGHRKKLLRAIAALAQNRIQARVPPPRAVADPERRQLTVMFCDLVGSTELSTRLDPEDLRDVILRFQECCAEVIGRFGGHIGNYIGDGILAYFGYPRAHEDDPQRAVRAGLVVVEAIAQLNVDLPLGIELAVRIGINTGVVVAGDIGIGESRDEMAVVGETPNIAARLQQLAEPGTVVVGARTYRLIEGLFLCDDLGALEVRGVSTPIRAYRVREATRASRFEATTNRGLTPLVGREHEIRLLLSRWDRAKQGAGQVVLLSGEPGIGKSRIMQTLRERLHNEPRVNLHFFCSPFYSNSALYPVLDQLERAAEFRRHDPPQVKLAKLETVLAQATERAAHAVALLAPLLAIPTEGHYPPLDLTPQQHRAEVFAVFLEQMAGLAARDPVLMIFEDAHWIDPTSTELFQMIVDQLQDLPVLLVIVFRPEFVPPWTGLPYVTSLSLGRLEHHQAAAMVERVTGGKALPLEVLDQIVARTDGVPLFVEELTKAIMESGLLEDAGDRYVLTGPLPPLAIPTTLHDSLMARLDRLAPVKEVAQLAATLGRVFSHELLAALSPLGQSALEQALAELLEAELLFRHTSSAPEITYQFKHALLQDAAYGSLLRTKRQQLHRRIGQVLEERFPHTVDARPELLAHHFREAGLAERALPYAMRAGDAAAVRYASAEARARYGDALELAGALAPSEAASREKIDAVLKLARVALNRDHFERDLKNLAEAEALAGALEDDHALCQIEYWIGRTNYVLGRFDAGVGHAERALAMAEALGGDDTVTASPINLLARIHCLRGEPRQAIPYASRNVGQMHRLGNRTEAAAVSGVLAFAYGQHGEFPQAFEAADHGIEVAREVEHLPTLAACLHFRGVAKGWHGELSDSVGSFEEALACCEKAGDVFRKYLIYGWRGEACLLADQVDAAEADLTRCLALGDQIGTTFHRGAFQAFLARIRLLEGDPDAALELSDAALKIATETGQAWSHSIALRICAEILAASRSADLARAEHAVRTAIEIQDRRECRCDLAASQLVLGQVLAAKGDPAGARAAAERAHTMYQQMGTEPGLAKARAALGEPEQSPATPGI